jgi:hypothetical protein
MRARCSWTALRALTLRGVEPRAEQAECRRAMECNSLHVPASLREQKVRSAALCVVTQLRLSRLAWPLAAP